MTDASLAQLAERLDAPLDPLAPLASMGVADLERLDQIVARAYEIEDAAFTEAIEGALRIVPRPPRGAARSLLFPGGAE